MLILISALLTAGCAAQQGEAPAASAGSYQLSAAFADGGDQLIRVVVTGEKPAAAIELVSPAGQVARAERIERTRISQRQAGQPAISMGVGVFGGSSSGVGTAVGIGVPLGGGGNEQGQSFTRSEADLPVGDMAAYRADWQRWQIRVSFDGPPRQIMTPAPRPPGG
jgi:hypothetical protein